MAVGAGSCIISACGTCRFLSDVNVSYELLRMVPDEGFREELWV